MSGEAELMRHVFGFYYRDFELPEDGIVAVHLTLRQFHAVNLKCKRFNNADWRMLRVVRQRFGIGTAKRTLAQVAAQLYNISTGQRGVTRERVRSMESKALRRLRHPRYSRSLKPYLPKFED